MLIIKIDFSVGKGGVNRIEDVATVQELLNFTVPPNGHPLLVDGAAGAKTIVAIENFQMGIVSLRQPDGRVDPVGKTFTALMHSVAVPLSRVTQLPSSGGTKGVTDADYDRIATALGCETAAIKAVAEVEAGGDGFFSSGRPKILFEAHQFSKHTGRKYDRLHPRISSPTWNKALYAVGEAEYDRLLRAMVLDRDAALKSASWGRFQIMGFNHVAAGQATIALFIDAMFRSEVAHLDAFAAFLKSTGLTDALKKKAWATFAKGYNGPDYAKNQYDTKLERAYNKYKPPAKK